MKVKSCLRINNHAYEMNRHSYTVGLILGINGLSFKFNHSILLQGSYCILTYNIILYVLLRNLRYVYVCGGARVYYCNVNVLLHIVLSLMRLSLLKNRLMSQ